MILPRSIDKARATLCGTNASYNYACPLDMYFFDFVSIDPAVFKKQIDAGHGDADLLNWIVANMGAKRLPHEIALWSRFMEDRTPSDVESREFFHDMHKTTLGARPDIATWFDLLDADDFVSYGGQL